MSQPDANQIPCLRSPPPPSSPTPPPLHLQPSIGSETLPSPKKVKKTTTVPAATSSSGGSSSRPSGGKHPIYRSIRSRGGKWVSEIREPKKTTRIWLGTYPSPQMAAAAYNVAALALKRSGTAVLNLPDRVSTYPVPASTSPLDIQKAAASAAASAKMEGGDGTIVGGPRGNDGESASDTETLNSWHEFIDKEALFHMPNLLKDMAEGMLVSPPRMAAHPSSDSPENSDAESLWSYF